MVYPYRYMARSFTFILPYFPTATMERVDTEGQIATAKVCRLIICCLYLTVAVEHFNSSLCRICVVVVASLTWTSFSYSYL